MFKHKIKFTFLASLLSLSLIGCFSVPMEDGSPVRTFGLGGSPMYTPPGTYTYPVPGFDASRTEDLGSKIGISCISQTYLLFFPTSVRGDMSMYAAAQAGGIKNIKLASYQVKRPTNLFGFASIFNDVVQYCTIVHGD